MDYPQMPEQIDASQDNFSQVIKPPQPGNKILNIARWSVAIFLTLCILALTWQQYTSFENVFVKIILPLALVYAVVFLPSRYPTESLDKKDIWYKEVRRPLGGSSISVPLSWQGWLIDFSTVILCILEFALVMSIRAAFRGSTVTNSSIGELTPSNSFSLLLQFSPILVIILINFRIRSKHTIRY